MGRLGLGRPSPALVVAVAALIAALGGSAFAGVAALDRSERAEVRRIAAKIDQRQAKILRRQARIIAGRLDGRAIASIPAGPQGEQGPPGSQGQQGPAGVLGPVEYTSSPNVAVACNVDGTTGDCLPGAAGYSRAVASAECPDGTRLLGGGFHLLGVTGNDTPGGIAGEVVSSEPFASGGAAEPNSWRVLYDTNSFTFEMVRAWASCAQR